MGFVNPMALFLGLLAVPILLLYMLKLRRRELLVSSTLLWHRLMRDREANAPWQRLRRNLLLLLQLLALALMTLALARPFISAPTVVTGDVIILLDVSASMQATDITPSRFEAARRIAREIIAGLGGGDVATLIAVGPQPRILIPATGDRALLRDALDRLTPDDGAADWEAACALAVGQADHDVETVIISDGALPVTLPPLPGDVRLVTVGGQGDNLAITALAVREGTAGVQALLRLTNFGDATAEPPVEFYADDILYDARRLTVPPHSDTAITLTDLPYDLRVLRAALSTADPFPLDNVAWAVHGGTTARRVLLLSQGNLFLERALSLLPDVELTRLTPGTPSAEEYDLYVYDGPITGTLPTGNLWLIGPPAMPEWGGAGKVFTATAVTDVADDPLLKYVDWSTVHILRAYDLPRPPDARVLVRAAGGPLLFVAERPEGRLAVLTFDLRESDLPLQISFPVLTVNLLNWLLPPSDVGTSAVAIRPGEPVLLRPPSTADRIVITAPDGERYLLPIGERMPVFSATDRVGLYRLEYLDRQGDRLRSGVLAVNLFDEAESDLAPRATVLVGQREVAVGGSESTGRRELRPWLAVAALLVLALEWWLYFVGRLSPTAEDVKITGATTTERSLLE